MKFCRYFNTEEKGLKRWGSSEYTSSEVRDALTIAKQENKEGWYIYFPCYQDRGPDFRMLYYPCKGIETVEQLEEFLRPDTYTYVWDNDEWKLKIHTPEQLLDFYGTLMDSNRETNRFVQNIEHIKQCNQQYDCPSLNELNEFLSKDASAYRFGVFQGVLMHFQMEQIVETGGILISKDLSYEFLGSPAEKFSIVTTSDTTIFPTEVPGLDEIEKD